MGNCMRNSKADILVPADEKIETQIGEAQKAKEQSINRRRKSVRFRVDDDKEKGQEMMKKGVVRIRLVMTQEELKKILNGQFNYSSADEFLRKIKSESKGRRIRSRKRRLYQDGFSEKISSSTSWRPTLECISEDH